VRRELGRPVMGRILAPNGTAIDGVNNAGQLMLQVCLMVVLPLLPLLFVAGFALNSLLKLPSATPAAGL
jgi:hypothetical protein